MDTIDYAYIAETICTALCSHPDLLAKMNNELGKLILDIEDPDSEIEHAWSPEQREQIRAFIDGSAYMVSEVVNGNRL